MPDEAGHFKRVQEALAEGTFRIRWDRYGQLPFNCALVPLKIKKAFLGVSDQEIVVALRLVSAVSALGCVVMTFVLARRYFGAFQSWLSALFLGLGSLTFLEWSTISHPDVPQLFFLLASIFCCCRLMEEGTLKWLIGAAVSAGLAFACKYLGILLLPIICLIAVRHRVHVARGAEFVLDREISTVWLRSSVVFGGVVLVVMGVLFTEEFAARYLTADGTVDHSTASGLLARGRIGAVICGVLMLVLAGISRLWVGLSSSARMAWAVTSSFRDMALAVVTFGVAFSVSSPYSWTHFDFVFGILAESEHTAFGHIFRSDASWGQWVLSLASGEVLARSVLGLALVGVAWRFAAGRKPGSAVRRQVSALILGWAVFFGLFLMVRVNLVEARYFLPVVPIIAVFAADGLVRVAERARTLLKSRLATQGAFTGVIGLTCLIVVGEARGGVSALREAALYKVEASLSVKVGAWLEQRYPASTTVLYDSYSYVPPSFRDATLTWGGTKEILRTVDPDVIVVNEHIASRFTDERRASRYFKGEAEFRERQAYYKELAAGELAYVLAQDFKQLQVYERATSFERGQVLRQVPQPVESDGGKQANPAR
jgi:4-amino-4-deoxy-L-arabinose transferase-like glycosyltransferase